MSYYYYCCIIAVGAEDDADKRKFSHIKFPIQKANPSSSMSLVHLNRGREAGLVLTTAAMVDRSLPLSRMTFLTTRMRKVTNRTTISLPLSHKSEVCGRSDRRKNGIFERSITSESYFSSQRRRDGGGGADAVVTVA